MIVTYNIILNSNSNEKKRKIKENRNKNENKTVITNGNYTISFIILRLFDTIEKRMYNIGKKL